MAFEDQRPPHHVLLESDLVTCISFFGKMAKWGEGDPRWIVEERPDATNVNNWHWTEKNADQWSKDKLNELFSR